MELEFDLSSEAKSVLIIEPSQARRSMLMDGFKQIGYSTIRAVPNVQDAFSLIDMDETPSWIVTPLMENESVNAIHLLVWTLRNPNLKQVRISLMINDHESYCLPNAFELGLYSWHKKADDIMTQMAGFAQLLNREVELGDDSCLVAAHYLRAHLKQDHRFSDLIDFEKSLLALYPNKPARKPSTWMANFSKHLKPCPWRPA